METTIRFWAPDATALHSTPESSTEHLTEIGGRNFFNLITFRFTKISLKVIRRAVKPLPLGGGYKARLAWNFCLSAFCVLFGDTAAGHAVSACGEIARPGGTGGWFVPVKFPTWECLRTISKPCSSGQSRGSRNPLRDAIARLPPLGIPRRKKGEDVNQHPHAARAHPRRREYPRSAPLSPESGPEPDARTAPS